MSQTTTTPRQPKDFSQINATLPIPNVIDVQRRSYERFLQMNLLPEERANQGLQAVFTNMIQGVILGELTDINAAVTEAAEGIKAIQ